MITNEMPNQVFLSSVIQADKRDRPVFVRQTESHRLPQLLTSAYTLTASQQ